MRESTLVGKRILAVDDKPAVLEVLAREILEACPDCKFETAATYHEAVQKIVSLNYDAVILNGMGTRDSSLLNLARMRNFPVAILEDTPNQATEAATRPHLSKEKMGEIVPFLKHVMRPAYSPWWSRLVADHVDSEAVKTFILQNYRPKD